MFQLEIEKDFVLNDFYRGEKISVVLEVRALYSYNFDKFRGLEDWGADFVDIYLNKSRINDFLKIRDDELLLDILREVEQDAEKKLELQLIEVDL